MSQPGVQRVIAAIVISPRAARCLGAPSGLPPQAWGVRPGRSVFRSHPVVVAEVPRVHQAVEFGNRWSRLRGDTALAVLVVTRAGARRALAAWLMVRRQRLALRTTGMW